MKRISGKESREQWDFLRKRTQRLPSTQVEDHVFDCSDLTVPSNKDLVDEVLNDYVQQWKDLDERKVRTENRRPKKRKSNNDEEKEEEEEEKPRHRLPNWGWHANRLRLPDKFDYATRQSSPPPESEGGEKVVSLMNPLRHVSYESELWHLFRSVPTSQELEKEAMEGAKCHKTRELHQEMISTLKENSRLDGHALSRMRHRDRHGLPPTTTDDDTIKQQKQPLVSTVRIECWRRQLKRGSSPDAHRMELEFLGTQTLLDVHKAIVELHQDDLWTTEDKDDISGLFFMEDTFYTTGSVDYATPIMEWLKQDTPDNAPVPLSRRYFLGIPRGITLTTKPMSQARLDQLQFRLGVRYYHVCHGDVECSVFVTDVRCRTPHKDKHYPIVHDVWTPTYPMVECEACQRLAAAVVVPPGNDLTHGGPTALCRRCHHQLFPKNQVTTIPYNVYREQSDLSIGHGETSTKALF